MKSLFDHSLNLTFLIFDFSFFINVLGVPINFSKLVQILSNPVWLFLYRDIHFQMKSLFDHSVKLDFLIFDFSFLLTYSECL